MHYKVLCVQKLRGFFVDLLCRVYRMGEKAMNRQVAAREAGDCASPHICCHWRAAAAMVFSHFLLPRGGAARAVVHGEAVNNGSGGESRRFRRIARSAMRRACRAPPISPRCAKWGGSALVRKTRRLARRGRGRGRGKPRCDIEALLRKGLTEYISREALNKSRHTSCLHIFRLIARKLLEIHQVFLRHFHTI